MEKDYVSKRSRSPPMKYTWLGKDGPKIPVLGMGTWLVGGRTRPDRSMDPENMRALRHGIRLGMSFIDTAEMYSGGHAEEIAGAAIAGRRPDVFVASKVHPHHFRYDDVLKACERSLRRLKTPYLDLYQLHWPSRRVPIRETMKAMERLVDDGKVRGIGVSNFDVKQTAEAQESLSRHEIASNQIEYSVLRRGFGVCGERRSGVTPTADRELKGILPFCEREGIGIIAYSPLALGAIFRGKPAEILSEVGSRCNKTISQVALNWLISKPHLVAIPKSTSVNHLNENLGALGWKLSSRNAEYLMRRLG